jgi:adenine-specific DNA-methyltransferase
MEKKQKLELTWIGKDRNINLEPRILIEDPEWSYHAQQRFSNDDEFDNKIIYGDNLLALKALEQEYTGKINCVYIDPPFNTGAAFEHYDDGIEHSIWLDLMYQRFNIIYNLLSENGVFVVHLDDSESAYAKVMLDEIFGRNNYLNTVTTTTNAPSGFKATSSKIFSTANQIIFYAKNKTKFAFKKVFIEKEFDKAYSKFLKNKNDHYSKWKWSSLLDVFCEKNNFTTLNIAKRTLGQSFDAAIAKFAIDNAPNVFRTASIGGGAAIKRKETINASKENRDQVFVHPNEDVDGFYILNGEQFVFYEDRLVEIDGLKVPGEVITDVWTDIPWTGIANEGAVDFKNGKKPEALIRRIFNMCTEQGDLVLDSFGGSGTTAAVAHKMKRRWITIELGVHCQTHIIPRLKNIIDGKDQSGISQIIKCYKGGGFRYYNLAPSLLEKDKWGQWVINKEYNANMLASAICKHEGFIYSPSETEWWNQGYSTENDFIYVTTQIMTEDQLLVLSEDVGSNRTLLICCSAFKVSSDLLNNKLSNLTLKKIPNTVMSKCEWGKDDYSLNINNLAQAQPEEVLKKVKLSKKDKTENLFNEED